MNNVLLPDLIEHNLYGLYKAFAQAGNYPVVQHPSYSWIKTNRSIFPGNIFQVDPGMNEAVFSELVTLIKNDQAPPFLVFRNDKASLHFFERLKIRGFRQVMHWPGMALSLHEKQQRILDDKVTIDIKRPGDIGGINDWAVMVERILFNGKKIDRNTLLKLIEIPDWGLYTGFLDGVPAGTLLSWTNDEVTGLYMITTLPEFRNKGIAWQMTHTALSDASSLGGKYAVLESSPQGLSLYRKAGFIEYCSFSIYWMLGKNYQHE